MQRPVIGFCGAAHDQVLPIWGEPLEMVPVALLDSPPLLARLADEFLELLVHLAYLFIRNPTQ